MRYRPELDGLRAIAVILVIGYHAQMPGFGNGFVGVTLFLVLSGYLVGGLAFHAAGPGGFAPVDFLIRRIRRIAPLMVLVIGVTLTAGMVLLLPAQLRDLGQAAVASILFVPNVLFWAESGYFTAISAEKPLLHLWSIGVEVQFYAVVALLVVMVPSGRRLGIVISALAAVSMAAGIWAAQAAPDAGYYLTPFRLWEPLAGALLALGLQGRTSAVSRGVALLGVVLILLTLALLTPQTPYPGAAALAPAIGTLCLVAGLRPSGPLTWAPMVWIGQRSYGLYLWHLPVLVLGRMALPDWPVMLQVPAFIGLTVLLAAASYPLVEQPFRAPWRRAWWRGAGVATAVLSVCLLGIAAHVGAGFPSRFGPDAKAFMAKLEHGTMPCHDRLEVQDVANGRTCIIGAPDAAPVLVVVGDSHAGHLTRAMDSELRSRGASALVYSRGWCAPMAGFGTLAPDRGPECADYMAAVWDRLVADSGYLPVVLAAEWGNYSQGMRAGLGKVDYRYAAGQTSLVGRPAFDAALEDTVVLLRQQRLRAIWIGSVPEYDSPVPDLMLRHLAATGQPLRLLVPSDLTDRALSPAQLGGAEFIDPAKIYCVRDGMCRVSATDGTPLYRDSNHLSRTGAAELVAEILRLVNDPPQQGGRAAWTSPPPTTAGSSRDRPTISLGTF